MLPLPAPKTLMPSNFLDIPLTSDLSIRAVGWQSLHWMVGKRAIWPITVSIWHLMMLNLL